MMEESVKINPDGNMNLKLNDMLGINEGPGRCLAVVYREAALVRQEAA